MSSDRDALIVALDRARNQFRILFDTGMMLLDDMREVQSVTEPDHATAMEFAAAIDRAAQLLVQSWEIVNSRVDESLNRQAEL